MGFCGACGTSMGDGIRFCPSCGAPAGSAAAPSAKGAKRVYTAQLQPATKAEKAAAKSGVASAMAGSDLSPVVEQLKVMYKQKILPLEKDYKFEDFHSPGMTDTDFDAKPMVLLIGQYSTGKTTFIKYLLERDFPGAHIGPEPTTDRFVAVMHGSDERIIPGNALAADASKPFTALNKFGMAFLNKFECSQCDSPILEKISFIDTPGVLSGEKQRIGRAYNFAEVIEWFAERADRILLLFDANKLDISDEFKTAIECLRGHDDKIRVVLNKADIEIQHLMRVYGALMWALGKVIRAPEVPRVYIGSFWDGPLRHVEMKKLLDAEQHDLLADLRALPRNSTVRKVNELVKRARMAKVHAHILNHLRNQFGVFGKKKTQGKLLDNLADQFKLIQRETNLPAGDFPNPVRFKTTIEKYDIHKFPKLEPKTIKNMDDVLGYDIPNLMKLLPAVEAEQKRIAAEGRSNGRFGGPAEGEVVNPFGNNEDDAPVGVGWAITRAQKTRYDSEFHALDLTSDNKVSGANAKRVLLKTKLEPKLLKIVWDLSDIDKDGALDADEFAVAMYIIDQYQAGTWTEFPATLPSDVVPPKYRKHSG